MYAVAARIQGAGVIEVPLAGARGLAVDADAAAGGVAPRPSSWCTCARPTIPPATCSTRADSIAAARRSPAGACVVVDEAYIECRRAPEPGAAGSGVPRRWWCCARSPRPTAWPARAAVRCSRIRSIDRAAAQADHTALLPRAADHRGRAARARARRRAAARAQESHRLLEERDACADRPAHLAAGRAGVAERRELPAGRIRRCRAEPCARASRGGLLVRDLRAIPASPKRCASRSARRSRTSAAGRSLGAA